VESGGVGHAPSLLNPALRGQGQALRKAGTFDIAN
jgi:hypothetical protein